MAFFKNLKITLQNSFPIFKRRKRSSSLPGDYESEVHHPNDERPMVGTATPQHPRSASVDRGTSRFAGSISLGKVCGAAAPMAGAAAAAVDIAGHASHDPDSRFPSQSSPSFRSDKCLDRKLLESATEDPYLGRETTDRQIMAAKATSPRETIQESKSLSFSSPTTLSRSHTPDVPLVSHEHVRSELKQSQPLDLSSEASESSLNRLIEQYVNKLIVSRDWSDTQNPQIADREDQVVINNRSPDISCSQNELCPQEDLDKSSGSPQSKEDANKGKFVSRSSEPRAWFASPNKDFKLSATNPDLSTDRHSPAMPRRQARSPKVPTEHVQGRSLELSYRSVPPVEATTLSPHNRPDSPHQPSLLLARQPLGNGRGRSPIRSSAIEGYPTLQQIARSPAQLSREVGSQLLHSGFRPIVLRLEREEDPGGAVAEAPLRVSGTQGEKLKLKRKAKKLQATVHAHSATQALESGMETDSATEEPASRLAGPGKVRSLPFSTCSSSLRGAAPKISQAAVQALLDPGPAPHGLREEKAEREGHRGARDGVGRKVASTTSCVFSVTSDTPSSSEGKVKDTEDAAYPSTSRQNGGSSEAAKSSSCVDPWLEEQMEEMVTTLKTRSSYGKRRSRSRSRRSRPRQTCENGMTITSGRMVQAFPLRLRETDSDDSNTSLGPTPAPTFFCSLLGPGPGPRNLAFPHAAGPGSAFVMGTTRRCNQSNSSFHSALQSDEALTPQTSTAADLSLCLQCQSQIEAGGKDDKEEEEEKQQEAGSWGGAGQEAGPGEEDEDEVAALALLHEAQLAAYNRSQQEGHNPPTTPTGVPLGMVLQDLGSYGPEEFVLDLFLTLCRGTWSDIL